MNEQDSRFPLFIAMIFGFFGVATVYSELPVGFQILLGLFLFVMVVCGAVIYIEFFSRFGREKRKVREQIFEVPNDLKVSKTDSVLLGMESDLKIPIYLPDHIRCRHVHILGATGSGKTESVILNLVRQDIGRGLGAIIVDAKGDISFLNYLKQIVPKERLQIFDLGDENSLPYNPLGFGSAIEAAQRLFSSLVWSEEYYRSKAFSALQRLFQTHFEINSANPTLADLAEYLSDPESYAAFVSSPKFSQKMAQLEFQDISGLRDQITSLSLGHLQAILSPKSGTQVNPAVAANGTVVYFRLQSLMSPQIVVTLGKLVINHLNFLAGTAHRGDGLANQSKFIPTFVDEFASFACPEFADLISKARSAKMALHFSHQSIGDLTEVSPGFINRIADNSATKIVMRINDPDSADYMARTFGTRDFQKVTQRITNAKEVDRAEMVGEGTARDAHQFRASPDLLKTLPTGVGSVLISHGYDAPNGAASVFKIRFAPLQIKGGNT